MIHDVVIEEKRYTGENAPRDTFKIIGAYTNHSDAYMAAKKQLVTAETCLLYTSPSPRDS